MKKLIIGLCTILSIIILVIGINVLTERETTEGSKTIYVVVNQVDEGIVLYEGEFNTESLYLSEFLLEQSELKVKLEDGEWGAFVVEMCGKSQNAISGPWWTYESGNNETCLTEGYCPGASTLPIADGDKFVFNLSSSY